MNQFIEGFKKHIKEVIFIGGLCALIIFSATKAYENSIKLEYTNKEIEKLQNDLRIEIAKTSQGWKQQLSDMSLELKGEQEKTHKEIGKMRKVLIDLLIKIRKESLIELLANDVKQGLSKSRDIGISKLEKVPTELRNAVLFKMFFLSKNKEADSFYLSDIDKTKAISDLQNEINILEKKSLEHESDNVENIK